MYEISSFDGLVSEILNQVAIGNHAADPITGRLYDLYCHDCGNKLDESDPAKLDGPGVMCTRCVEMYRMRGV